MSNVTTLTAPTITETVVKEETSSTEIGEEVTIPNLVSDKKAEWLIKTATAEATSPENVYRKLIELTYANATIDTRKRVPYREVISNYAKGVTDLNERLNFARTVAFNTAKKMTHGLPDNFAWAYLPKYEATIVGIFRGTDSNSGRERDITAELASGKATISSNDRIRFEVKDFRGSKVMGELPIHLLGNDPIAAAQYIRGIAKSHRQAEEVKARANARKENVELANQIKALEEKIAKNAELLKNTP